MNNSILILLRNLSHASIQCYFLFITWKKRVKLLKTEFPYILLRTYHFLHHKVISWFTRKLISMIQRAIYIWMVSKCVFYKRKVKIIDSINFSQGVTNCKGKNLKWRILPFTTMSLLQTFISKSSQTWTLLWYILLFKNVFSCLPSLRQVYSIISSFKNLIWIMSHLISK